MKINGYDITLGESELDEILKFQMRPIDLISKDFESYINLPEGDKQAIEHLLNAARIINDVALEQDHPLNLTLKQALENAAVSNTHAAKALELFTSLNGVAGYNGIDKNPIEIFKGIELLPGKNFYPPDMNVAEFHQILLKMAQRGKIDEIRKILSARTMVRRKDDELTAIDYTEYFAEEFSEIAKELKAAAATTTEPELREFLNWQAQALLQNNPDLDMLADQHWAEMQNNNVEFTISRENYEDELTGTVYDNMDIIRIIGENNILVTAKDTLGCRVGIVNRPETDKILVSKKTLPYFAKWMPYNDLYTQTNLEMHNLKQTMVDVDLIALTGDYAMCRGGITTAQNLPNNDKLSVQKGGGRRNVYHRQVRFSKDEEREKKLLDILVAPSLHQYIDRTKAIIFVIGHENGHSLGPDSSYQNALGMYKHIIEEHKADVISIASIAEVARHDHLFDEETLKKIYASWVVGNLFLRAQPVLSKPHRVADLMQFNYLMENKVIWFDAAKKLNIHFDLVESVMYRLLKETIEVQLSKSAETAKDFINRWAYWGDYSKYVAAIQEELGIKPYIKIITKF